ncbi:uncharacterized protein LOC143462433 [Clavelina lepadiformis]|uniref:Cocaine- and amphetamine-regulated transcript protein n=1 Tax=Clavelina lepadiformis TaxID=159417 RepID=A0ABP0FJQ7_CLALP
MNRLLAMFLCALLLNAEIVASNDVNENNDDDVIQRAMDFLKQTTNEEPEDKSLFDDLDARASKTYWFPYNDGDDVDDDGSNDIIKRMYIVVNRPKCGLGSRCMLLRGRRKIQSCSCPRGKSCEMTSRSGYRCI